MVVKLMARTAHIMSGNRLLRPHEILTTYLAQINVVRSTGQANPEVSYYPALAGLLNAVGQSAAAP